MPKQRDIIEPANSRTQIEFRGVYKNYKNGTHALQDFNLKINRGEFVFVVGPSGAGKCTFMQLIMREEKMSAGEITVSGYKLSKIKRRQIPQLRRTMGIVFQDFRLIPTMTVAENVAFAMHIVGASKQEIRRRVANALNLVGLASKARCKPTEPTGNVDPQMSYEIVDLLTEINRRGTTIVMVTHEHQLVRDFNRRVVMIENGRVVADNAASAEDFPVAPATVPSGDEFNIEMMGGDL